MKHAVEGQRAAFAFAVWEVPGGGAQCSRRLLCALNRHIPGLIHSLLTPCQSPSLLISQKNVKTWPKSLPVVRGLELNLAAKKQLLHTGPRCRDVVRSRRTRLLHSYAVIPPGNKGEQQETRAIIAALFVISDMTWQKSGKGRCHSCSQKESTGGPFRALQTHNVKQVITVIITQ